MGSNPKGIAGRAGAATAAVGGPVGTTGPGEWTAADPGRPPAPRPRVRDALTSLEYPRHLHKAGGEYLRVENESDARAAVADGWCVAANSPRIDDSGAEE